MARCRSTAATWDSVNVIFAQLDLDVGPENVTQTAHEMGIEADLESVPAEAIGGLSEGVTPLEQADGYATLASGGIHHDPTAIGRVEFPNGKVDEPDPESGDRVLTEGQAYEVTRLLEGVITQGTGAGYTYMGCPAEAGKTGTSEGLSDAWFVGYTPLYSTAVWVGHPQSREETGFGGPTAGPIWRSFMESAAAGNCPEFPEPSSLPELSGLNERTHLFLVGRAERRRIRRRRIDEEGAEGQGGRQGRAARTGSARTGTRARTGAGAGTGPRSAARGWRRHRQPALSFRR